MMGYETDGGYMGKIGAIYILFNSKADYEKAYKRYWS